MRRAARLGGVMVAALMMASACGGSDSPSAPSGGGGGSITTVTITSAGVAPKSVTVSQGSRVMFVNNDTRAHNMASDPHPDHSLCGGEIGEGSIAPGGSRTTGNLNTVRTCGYHDHDNPGSTALQGTIVVQ